MGSVFSNYKIEVCSYLWTAASLSPCRLRDSQPPGWPERGCAAAGWSGHGGKTHEGFSAFDWNGTGRGVFDVERQTKGEKGRKHGETVELSLKTLSVTWLIKTLYLDFSFGTVCIKKKISFGRCLCIFCVFNQKGGCVGKGNFLPHFHISEPLIQAVVTLFLKYYQNLNLRKYFSTPGYYSIAQTVVQFFQHSHSDFSCVIKALTQILQ